MSFMDVPITQESSQDSGTTNVNVITLEAVLYLALIILALVMRFAELDSVPLTSYEARQALSAWRVVYPEAPGTDIVPESPLLFLLHRISFSTLGASEFSARLWTAIAGATLAFTPLLFRDLLGRGRAFAFCLLLACSPVLLAASRFDSPVIWSMLLAAIALWGIWQYWKTQKQGYGLLATTAGVSVLLLADPAGYVLALILVISTWLALTTIPSENGDTNIMMAVREKMRDWPWRMGLAVSAGTVILVSTGFLFYQPGLNAVSELLTSGFDAIRNARSGAPIFFPLITALVYEPYLWLFAAISLFVVARRGNIGFIERFFSIWVLWGTLATALFSGGGPEHALWFTIPLTGLSATLAADLLKRDENALWEVPWWATWLAALGMIALLFVLTVNLQAVGRAIIDTVDGNIFTAAQRNPLNVVWLVVAMLFIVVGYFLAAGIWTDRTALRGVALGLLLFSAVTSLASGWRAAVTAYDNPAELWHVQASSREIPLLAESLAELKEREAKGFPEVPIVALAPDDGVVAWLLRDFSQARFITDVDEARSQEIALLPLTVDPPTLGGDYVGQQFAISHVWNPQVVVGLDGQHIGDWIGWWTHLQTRVGPTPLETMVLWLRQDIYNGVPFDENSNAR